MKRKTAIIFLILSMMTVVYADNKDDLIRRYAANSDYESIQIAKNAPVPAGLTEREAAIYLAGYAMGRYDALNPADIPGVFILNTSTKKYHRTNCSSAVSIAPKNREYSTLSSKELERKGYSPCKNCRPDLQ